MHFRACETLHWDNIPSDLHKRENGSAAAVGRRRSPAPSIDSQSVGRRRKPFPTDLALREREREREREGGRERGREGEGGTGRGRDRDIMFLYCRCRARLLPPLELRWLSKVNQAAPMVDRSHRTLFVIVKVSRQHGQMCLETKGQREWQKWNIICLSELLL